jgi:hypothetical protein
MSDITYDGSLPDASLQMAKLTINSMQEGYSTRWSENPAKVTKEEYDKRYGAIGSLESTIQGIYTAAASKALPANPLRYSPVGYQLGMEKVYTDMPTLSEIQHTGTPLLKYHEVGMNESTKVTLPSIPLSTKWDEATERWTTPRDDGIISDAMKLAVRVKKRTGV